MHAKAHLRRCLLSKRAAFTALEVQKKSAGIATRICALSTFRTSQTIMVYMALAQEVQTARIIVEAKRQNKRIVAPVVQGPMLAAVELSLDSVPLCRGPYGIFEPRWSGHVVPPEEIPFVVVPGIAFDRQGGRLGFGKGYYDRFLQRMPDTAYYCGLAFAMQIVPRVPRMEHDVCMHGVVTEQEFISCEDQAID